MQSPDTFTVVPAALSVEHTSVRGLPRAVIAGVPTDFTIHPTDQYGNLGAQGTESAPKLSDSLSDCLFHYTCTMLLCVP